MQQEPNKTKNNERDWEQEFENFGNEAVDRVKGLVAEGNIRRLVIRKADDVVLLDIPLTPAVIVGVVMTFWMPFMTLLAAIAGFVAKLKVEVVHVETVNDNTESVEITA